MYFFLLNLSLIDLGSISTTVPKAMANSLWDTKTISNAGCATQVFMFAFFLTAEFYLLTVMAHDRYMAICKPLHYGTIMDSRTCAKMAAAAWVLYSVLPPAVNPLIYSMRNKELKDAVWKLMTGAIACNHRLHTPMYFFLLNLSLIDLGTITTTVPKAMANCLTGIFAYLKPPSISSPFLNLLLAVLYSMVPPALNPLIYSMQNKELKCAVRRQIWGMFS
ncbi:olfactory receptor 14J1-like, partial [Aythya fuligula]|uniref:Olfactory receptor 14J1-like n=1 Tax=Aythya fuligula TaxID=219594 RepID=A0A6J3EP55_AYTFU